MIKDLTAKKAQKDPREHRVNQVFQGSQDLRDLPVSMVFTVLPEIKGRTVCLVIKEAMVCKDPLVRLENQVVEETL